MSATARFFLCLMAGFDLVVVLLHPGLYDEIAARTLPAPDALRDVIAAGCLGAIIFGVQQFLLQMCLAPGLARTSLARCVLWSARVASMILALTILALSFAGVMLSILALLCWIGAEVLPLALILHSTTLTLLCASILYVPAVYLAAPKPSVRRLA